MKTDNQQWTPWRADGRDIRDAGEAVVATVYYHGESETEAHLDACLLAAAPDLLEAAEQAEYWLEAERTSPGQAIPDEILRVLRAAIKKASE